MPADKINVERGGGLWWLKGGVFFSPKEGVFNFFSTLETVFTESEGSDGHYGGGGGVPIFL